MREGLEQEVKGFIRRALEESLKAYEQSHHDLQRYQTEIEQAKSFERKLMKKIRRLPLESRRPS